MSIAKESSSTGPVLETRGLTVRFGGHVAVLGNTGSGKSCTVASVLQSLFSKPEEHHARGATFIVFDVNGEYHAALSASAKEDSSRSRTRALWPSTRNSP